ncbi:unnamed protein product, partial [Didymodactylos carnosus]
MLEKLTSDQLTHRETTSGNTLLHIACEYGHSDIVQQLLEHDCDRLTINSKQLTPYEQAANDGIHKWINGFADVKKTKESQFMNGISNGAHLNKTLLRLLTDTENYTKLKELIDTNIPSTNSNWSSGNRLLNTFLKSRHIDSL